MKNIFKNIKKGACVLLAAGFLAACAPPAANTNTATLPPAKKTTSPAPAVEMQPPQQEDAEVIIMLPSGMEDFARQLAGIAAKDGITLRMVTKPAGITYADAVQQELAKRVPPDIYWLESEVDAAEITETGKIADMLTQSQSPAMAALADMVPKESRPVNASSVYGLPLGYYTEGYLVNIEVLAGLLSTDDIYTLMADLTVCTQLQWEYLIDALQNYLQNPSRVQLKIGNNSYTTPSYRPAEAKPLRGMFAVPEREETPLVSAALNAVMDAAFPTYQDWLNSPAEDKSDRIAQVLPAFLDVLDIETIYMGSEEGAVWRGADFPYRSKAGIDDAISLLANGTVLFVRTDSRQAANAVQKTPGLAGSLAMVPVKLTLLEEDLPQENANDTETGENEETSTDVLALYDIENQIKENNKKLAYASDGYLCITPGTKRQPWAESLLLRLYTTEEGREIIAGLGLTPFTTAGRYNTLETQTWQTAVAGQGRRIVMPQTSLARAQKAIGEVIYVELMEQAEWDVTLQRSFYSTFYTAMGLPYQPPPEVLEN